MSKPPTAMGQAAEAPNPETCLQCGSRRIKLGVEDYAAGYTGLEDGRDTKSRWAMVGISMKIPLERLSSSVRPRQILPPLNRHGRTGLIIAVPEKVGQISFRAERKQSPALMSVRQQIRDEISRDCHSHNPSPQLWDHRGRFR